ncbi:hypothetical protein SAMN04488134_104187 [Amphibacillus marinus]|uniref:Cof subfamily of IIB subfamily of haloacid dehalogenase superfamily/HAD-superfamily hydrolase, subfamily IIB n=1 Tax=Amphibacillus marinus TaxID=872970 RepID=A0A1H8MK41_9BACI|nr:Cof-type HAD-IIB family hydrolase [Amphibacillus marinus]SEO17781.1 hypothetical protein SAMN04488134_104187 [Amphibacillus marinus]
MPTPKAIFLDMDGTLLNHDNQVTERTKDVIKQIRAKGIKVFVATGRGNEEIYPTAPDDFEIDGFISSNGMSGYLSGRKLFEYTLPVKLVKEVIIKARTHQVYYELFPTQGACLAERQDYPYFSKETYEPKPESVGINEWTERLESMEQAIEWVDKIEEGQYSKFYFFSKEQAHIQSWGAVLASLQETLPFSTSSSTPHNIELMVAGKNKATAIEEFLAELAIDAADILVMGDSFNDVQMFALAGEAVAMKNAPKEIKDLATDVTTHTCDEEGVYHYLYSRFLTK